jgi:hypothetical protein
MAMTAIPYFFEFRMRESIHLRKRGSQIVLRRPHLL